MPPYPNINFSSLQSIYNRQMDLLLASNGLTTKCQLNFGVTNKQLCPNCIYDPILKKSSNKYKSGGPLEFTLGMLCPYCNGIGVYGRENTETIYMAIIADNRKWINPPINIAIADNMIQSICSAKYASIIKQSKSMTVLYSTTNDNPQYTLYGDPNSTGLGDNNYIFCMWKNI